MSMSVVWISNFKYQCICLFQISLSSSAFAFLSIVRIVLIYPHFLNTIFICKLVVAIWIYEVCNHLLWMYHQTNMGETWQKRANYYFDDLHLDHPEVQRLLKASCETSRSSSCPRSSFKSCPKSSLRSSFRISSRSRGGMPGLR